MPLAAKFRAQTTATSLWNHAATSRKGSYYRAEVHPDNSVNPVYLSVTNTAVLASGTNDYVTNWTGNLFLPKALETFGYDADGNQRMTTTKSYDYLNRLARITNAASASASGSESPAFAYANNSANQRTSITNADGSQWLYSYDALGQVTSGKKYLSDGTPVAGQQFDYYLRNKTGKDFGSEPSKWVQALKNERPKPGQ